jgi:putative membrane protein
MRRTHYLFVLGFAAIAGSSQAQPRDSAPPRSSQNAVAGEGANATQTPPIAALQNEHGEDVDFLLAALRTAFAEIDMGQLAEERSENSDVRAYGRKLQADHAVAAREIERMLQTQHVTIPTEPSVEAEAHHAALERLSGADFDAAFVRWMIASHEEAIEQYGAQTHANPNKELANFAGKALPVLREHLVIAHSLR